MSGLRIKTAKGEEKEVYGPVTYKYLAEGKVYYCGGASWPAEIVVEVLK